MNNARGNRFSKDHQWIDVERGGSEEQKEFFSYSFSEMGKYDQPALWKYVMGVTR